MHLINKFNKGIRFLLYVIDVFNNYAEVIPIDKLDDIVNKYNNTCRSTMQS